MFGEWAGATIERLPLWGPEAKDYDTTFEWPSQHDWLHMRTPDVKLQSIEVRDTYKYDRHWLGLVKVNLSNG